MTDRQLNATAASLLGFLHDGPLAGWDLVVTTQQVIGNFWSLTQSQVYRELATMERDGLVRAGERGPRDRKPFSLTDEGRTAFATWVAREPGPETIRFPLLLTVAFGAHVPPGRLASFLAGHRDTHAGRLAAYEQQRREATAVGADMVPDGPAPDWVFSLATLDFGIAYERAVLDWFDALPPSLGAHTDEGDTDG